ncbi:MAG: YHS domain-containing protein, partial [Gammaproteobacteria bacterium]|nr:YHS domain-containing protein [Gammaproteobacteria bacterium]
MTVTAESEHRYAYRGTDYFFCCAGCRDKFAADPEPYLHPPEQAQVETAASASCASEASAWVCPMCPGVRESEPVPCPSCGMALEPEAITLPATRTEYTCPMHPEVVQGKPGTCPRCGMALEPRTIAVEERNEELIDMTRRFWVSSLLALPVFVLAMIADLAPSLLPSGLSTQAVQWTEFVLATPVVIWGGWPFFVRGWRSVVSWNLNMFTLIGLGVSVAWTYSTVALLFPGLFPVVMQHADGTVAVYFEAAAVITALVLLGQVLELRARSQTNAAIRMLLG